jgi:hypothetical protein
MIPTYLTYPRSRSRPPRSGASDQELAFAARRHGQFKNDQAPSVPDYAPGGPGVSHELPSVRRPQQNAWEGTYARQAPGYFPLQSIQPVVAPVQWNAEQRFNGYSNVSRFHQPQYQVPLRHEYQGPMQYNQPSYIHEPSQYSGAQQHGIQPLHHGQFPGPPRFPGQSEFHPPVAHSVPQTIPPDPEKTPTPQMRRRELEYSNKENRNKENHDGPVHSWTDASKCPQSSGTYVPPPLPPIDLDLVVKVLNSIPCVFSLL